MRLLIAGASLLLLTNCRAFDSALLHPASLSLPVRLPALSAEVHLYGLRPAVDSVRAAAVAQDIDTLFAQEVRQVLALPTGSTQGTAVLTVRRVRYGEGFLYSFVSGASLCSLNLLGFPAGRIHCTTDVVLDIRNRHGELVGTYYTQGKGAQLVGFYGRPKYTVAIRTAYLLSVRQGLAQLLPQLQAEMPQLRAALAD
ncbi:MAG: hypothetical protein ACRYFX_23970 [Janthinobacterium lividum]